MLRCSGVCILNLIAWMITFESVYVSIPFELRTLVSSSLCLISPWATLVTFIVPDASDTLKHSKCQCSEYDAHNNSLIQCDLLRSPFPVVFVIVSGPGDFLRAAFSSKMRPKCLVLIPVGVWKQIWCGWRLVITPEVLCHDSPKMCTWACPCRSTRAIFFAQAMPCETQHLEYENTTVAEKGYLYTLQTTTLRRHPYIEFTSKVEDEHISTIQRLIRAFHLEWGNLLVFCSSVTCWFERIIQAHAFWNFKSNEFVIKRLFSNYIWVYSLTFFGVNTLSFLIFPQNSTHTLRQNKDDWNRETPIVKMDAPKNSF